MQVKERLEGNVGGPGTCGGYKEVSYESAGELSFRTPSISTERTNEILKIMGGTDKRRGRKLHLR